LEPAQHLTQKAEWRDMIQADSACLAEALESWLTGPLDAKPIHDLRVKQYARLMR
jgi:hypothetical protein